MKEYFMYVYSFTITRDLLDELGHANYNKLKDHLEIARHRLCKFLGFGRKTLRKQLHLGLFMLQDTYKYHKQLREGDVAFTLAQIAIEGRTGMTINLKLIRSYDATKKCDAMEITNEVEYKMVLVNLQGGRPVRICKEIVRVVEQFNRQQSELMRLVET